jgi:hypothetical protein
MSLNELMIAILARNQKKDVYKSDSRIKASVIRVIHELMATGLVAPDDDGKIMNIEVAKFQTLSNYALLNMLESILLSTACKERVLITSDTIRNIESIDYLGKCWYSPKEIAIELEKQTLKRHNKDKVRRMLDSFVRQGDCLRLTDTSYNRKYRIIYSETKSQKVD